MTRKFFISKLSRPGDLVKAQIIALGIRLGDLAAEAGCSNASLTALVTGANRSRSAQYRVFRALVALTGCRRLTMEGLWGALLTKEAA